VAEEGGLTYAAAGVDIAAGERAVGLIAPLAASTRRPEVIGGIGGFGGLMAIPSGYRQPVLVASTDGVGTKLELARATDHLDGVGIDLVAMCVDDLVCHGAEPLFFLDYLATAKLDPDQVHRVVAGVAAGCRLAGCTLLGGEMAEHPGTMPDGSFDLAGFAVGVAERDRLIDGSAVRPGDVLIGLLSPGLRSNGYSLARAIVASAGMALNGPAWPGSPRTLAEELLVPSVIYAPAVLSVIAAADVHAVAHITGGGLPGNLPRVLPAGVVAVVDRGTWEVPRIFGELVKAGRVADEESLRVFNQGVGMVMAVAPADGPTTVELLGQSGVGAVRIGHVEPGERGAAPVLRLLGQAGSCPGS
jgi:phosphoribosylformylglycinamidine cyclo-ligase